MKQLIVIPIYNKLEYPILLYHYEMKLSPLEQHTFSLNNINFNDNFSLGLLEG